MYVWTCVCRHACRHACRCVCRHVCRHVCRLVCRHMCRHVCGHVRRRARNHALIADERHAHPFICTPGTCVCYSSWVAGAISALSRHRRRHVHCAGMGVPSAMPISQMNVTHPFICTPGTCVCYSSTNFVLAGLVLIAHPLADDHHSHTVQYYNRP